MNTPRTRDLLLFSLLFFPINLFWTPMTIQVLPLLVKAVAGDANKGIGMAIVGSGGAIAATIVTLIVGVLSDNTSHRRGRRYPWVVWGFCIGAPATLFLPLASDLWQLLLVYVVVRLGLNAAQSAYSAIVPDRVPANQQGQAAGFGEFWDLLGLIGGILLMFLLTRGVVNGLLKVDLAPAQELRAAILIICAVCAVLMLVCLLLNLRWVHGEVLGREQTVPWRTAMAEALNWRPRQAPDFCRLLLARYVMNIGMFTGGDFLYYYAGDALNLGSSEVSKQVTFIILFGCTGGLLGALTSAYLGDRTSKRKLLYVYTLICAGAAVMFCLTHSAAEARWIAVLYNIGQSGVSAVEWAFATTLVPKGREARYLAIHQTANTIPQIAVTIVGGLVGHNWGYRALFWTIPIWLIIGMLLLTRVNEKPLTSDAEVQPA